MTQIKKHFPVAILAGVMLFIFLAILIRYLVWLASARHPFENIELSEAIQYYSPSCLYTFTEEELVFIEDELRNVVAYGEENPKSVVVDGHLQSVAKKGCYRLTNAKGEGDHGGYRDHRYGMLGLPLAFLWELPVLQSQPLQSHPSQQPHTRPKAPLPLSKPFEENRTWPLDLNPASSFL